MEDSWAKIEKLIGLFDGFFCFLLDELVAVLSGEVFFDDLECFLVHTVMNRFAHTENHVKHEVPVIVIEADETFGGVFFLF